MRTIVHPATLLILALAFGPTTFAPITRVEAGSLTGYGTAQWLMRTLPALGGAVGGWFLGGPLGLFGKIVGAYVGLKIGVCVGDFIARTINPLLPGSYQYGYNHPPPYYPDQGYGGFGAWSPQSETTPAAPATSADAEAAKAQRDAAVETLKVAVDQGSAAEQAAAHEKLRQAQLLYDKLIAPPGK